MLITRVVSMVAGLALAPIFVACSNASDVQLETDGGDSGAGHSASDAAGEPTAADADGGSSVAEDAATAPTTSVESDAALEDAAVVSSGELSSADAAADADVPTSVPGSDADASPNVTDVGDAAQPAPQDASPAVDAG